jgi:hypothetical protein
MLNPKAANFGAYHGVTVDTIFEGWSLSILPYTLNFSFFFFSSSSSQHYPWSHNITISYTSFHFIFPLLLVLSMLLKTS